MEDLIWLAMVLLWFIWSRVFKARKATRPVAPVPAPADEYEGVYEEVSLDRLDGRPEGYFEVEPVETPSARFAGSREEPAAPKPVGRRPPRAAPAPMARPRYRGRARRRIPNLKTAVIWSEILAPPVALRNDQKHEV